jgi:CRP-like cAMP-binding protein
VLEGELRAFDPGQGKAVDFCTIGQGDFFGEISLLDHGTRSASVQATQPSRLLRFTGDELTSLRRDQPAIAGKFLYALSRASAVRMRRVSKQYTDSMGLGLGR